MANDSIIFGIGGDTSGLQQSLNRATSAVASATSRMASAGFGQLLGPIAAVAAGVGSITAIMSGMKGALDLGSEMVDLSNRTGVAVESLYGLRLAFKDAGVDAEKLGPAVNKMQKALASAVGGGKEGDVLKSLGLDPQSLASMDSGQAFARIGNAIAQLPNSVERSAAAMALFGKSGGELLQVFMDPNFKEAGNISEAARLLGENAATFDRASDALGRSGSKVSGFFIGVGSQVVPQLNAAVAAFERLDLASAGKDVGGAVSVLIQALIQGQMGKLIWLDLKVAFENAINFLAGGLFVLFGSIPAQMAIILTILTSGLAVLNETSFWTGLGATLMSFVNSFNAGLLGGIASLINEMRNIPLIGGSIGKGADAIDQKAAEFRNLAMQQGSGGYDKLQTVNQNFRNQVADSIALATSDFAKKFQSVDLFGGGSGQELDSLISTLYDAGAAANAAARAENAGRKPAQSTFNGAEIGQVAKQSIFADSLAKIGGGGISVGGGSNPILEENKRQTSLLQSINQNLAKGMMSPVMAEFAPSY